MPDTKPVRNLLQVVVELPPVGRRKCSPLHTEEEQLVKSKRKLNTGRGTDYRRSWKWKTNQAIFVFFPLPFHSSRLSFRHFSYFERTSPLRKVFNYTYFGAQLLSKSIHGKWQNKERHSYVVRLLYGVIKLETWLSPSRQGDRRRSRRRRFLTERRSTSP